MKITEIKEENKIVLKVEGRVDTTTSPELQNAILLSLQKMSQLEVDFSDLEYISSAGLRSLLMGHKTAASKGGAMKVLHPNDIVMEVFKVTGFDNVLTIEN